MPFLRALLLSLMLPTTLMSQDITEERVSFAAGSSSANITGQITGYQIVDYVLGASAGQWAEITFAPSNPSAYFNLLLGDNPEALHIGSIAGNSFAGALPENGDYRIRVYLMRSAARREETATYQLDIAINARPGDADGLSGGPDRWEVFGLVGDTLNIRSGPSTADRVIAQVRNGDQLTARDGCVMTGATRWCGVVTSDGQQGWAAGRYLREASTTPEITGQLPCATRIGQPMTSCPFRAARGTPGTAAIWIALPQGGERYVAFADGVATETDPGLSLSTQRIPEITLLQIGDAERYEIPDAIVFGG